MIHEYVVIWHFFSISVNNYLFCFKSSVLTHDWAKNQQETVFFSLYCLMLSNLSAFPLNFKSKFLQQKCPMRINLGIKPSSYSLRDNIAVKVLMTGLLALSLLSALSQNFDGRFFQQKCPMPINSGIIVLHLNTYKTILP